MRSAASSKRHAVILLFTAPIVCLAARASAQQPAPMRAGGLAPPPMQSGGLAPPPPGSGPPPPAPMVPAYPNAAQRQLEEAEHSDSGRGLEFVYFNIGGGGEYAGLTALSESGTLVPASDSSAFGPYFSASGGLRLLFLTVGPQFHFAHFTNWDLWTLNLDVGWHVPLGNLEPYAFLGGGFAKLGHSADTIPGVTGVSVSGFDVRLGGGLDYYVTNVLSVGGAVDVDLLRLSRSGTPPVRSDAMDPGSLAIVEAISRDASSLGLVVHAGAVVGLHF